MTKQEYQEQYTHYVELTEARLVELCDAYLPESSRIAQAARYSLLSGGKRVRAVLTLAACKASGTPAVQAVDYACALEMLHCYSLIHDDLPCMDNDDFRRGRPSCHKQYDEATALLAADALVTAAFEVIANAQLPAEICVKAARILAAGGGAMGMLYGQELDKQYEVQPADEDQLRELHRHKTGKLIVAAVELGCIAAGEENDFCTALAKYAEELGLVFQIVDDMLDVTSTEEELGKPIGSDAANGKTTFVTLYGLEGASKLAVQHNEAACEALGALGERGVFLHELAVALLKRNK